MRGLGGGASSGAFDGSAGFSLPLPLSPSRGAPELSLSYSSNAGNGAFGIGIAVELPSISRLTNRGVPSYADSDGFSLSGAGALTPALQQRRGGGWDPLEREEARDGITFRVRTFRPRLENGWPLIERWENAADGVAHWLVTDGANTTSRLGCSEASRIADPGDPSRTAEWLLDETTDAKGNRTAYEYAGEGAQRYPAAVRYGNYRSEDGERFALELVFDYGERRLDDLAEPAADPYSPVRPWGLRADAFSSFAYGFELRTARLCRALLMFHRFAELGAAPCLVASLRLGYEERPTGTLAETILHAGHRRRADGSYLTRELPPLALTWSRWDPPPAPRFEPLKIDGRAATLAGRGGDLQPLDLDGEGLPGLLHSDGSTTYYCRPLGEGAYAPPVSPSSFPNLRDLRNPSLSLEDVDGDGRLDLVATTATEAGYFGRAEEGGWRPFVPYARTPTPLGSGGGELVDLDGNGRSDLMVLGKRTVRAYPAEGGAGFGAPRVSERPPGFPAAGGRERRLVTFANLFGDGLAHRVRVADGEVEVWPSLGRGSFAPARLLQGAPAFAAATAPERIFFADVDGSGAADLVFAYADRLEIHLNQAGNGFGPALEVALPVQLSKLDRIAFADILGTGTTAVLLVTTEPRSRSWFCDLCDGAKPYLLTGMDDNAGAGAEIVYASSTHFYLEDERRGRPWPTRLPFPVQVVERVIATDAVAGTRTVRRHRYRDGWFDPEQRQFRGFGFVESWDAESFEERTEAAGLDGAPPPPAELHGPPARTRSWFQVGDQRQSDELRAARRREQFDGDPDAYAMPESLLDPAARAANQQTLRQAHGALTGQLLRSELYGEDGSEAAAVPYAVSESNYAVQMLQPALGGAHGCFHVRARETLNADYERDPSDPRISHEFGLELTLYDDDGRDSYRERSCTIEYPRRPGARGPGRVPEQARTRARAAEGRLARVPAPFRQIGAGYEQRTFELGGIVAAPGAYLAYEKVAELVAEALAAPVPYGSPFTGPGPQSRLSTWTRSIYWDEDQEAPLPPEQISARALPHHVERAAFPSSWVQTVFGDRIGEADLLAAGFVFEQASATWWDPGLVEVHHGPSEPEMFFATRETASPAALCGGPGPFSRTTVCLDAPYALQPTETEAYVDAQTKLPTAAVIDYAALRPWQLTDANGIVHQALLDPLGLLCAGSTFKPAAGEDPRVGDGDLRAYAVAPEPSLEDVLARPLDYLQEASFYHFTEFVPWRVGERPPATIELERPHFLSRGPATADELALRITYRDGSGRELVRLTACDPEEVGEESEARWIVGPRTVYDNKGRPVEEYLPVYAATPDPAPICPPQPAGGGGPPSRTTHYDPLGRPRRIDTPKGFFAKTERSAWEERSYDADDTVLDSRFYREFIAGLPPEPSPAQRAEEEALEAAAAAYNTPATVVFDNAGHSVRRIRDNLGDVRAERFAEIVRGTPISAEELWRQLIAKGYLASRGSAPAGTWLTDRFDPYAPGFALELEPPFDQFATAVTGLLLQGRLTELQEFDAEGRLTRAADPRLFMEEVRTGARHTSISCVYAMAASDPALTESADAGSRHLFSGALGDLLSSWDARGLRSDRGFDGLRRPLQLQVTDTGKTRLRERIAYGDGRPDAARHNLLGQPYRVEDGAGVLTTPEYEIDGHPRCTTRQFSADPHGEPDWAGEVPLDPAVYATRLERNSFGEPVAEATPDGSTTRWAHHRSGRLAAVSIDPAGGGAVVSVLAAAAYDAAGQRTVSELGNGAVRRDSFEATTLRLQGRETAAPGGAALQRIAYTYDPVGNVTLAEDSTAALAFGTRQPVSRAECSYDPLYRLRSASGLQAPGLSGETYATGFKQTLFAPLDPGPETPAVTLEGFVETYSYDASGNLVALEHEAGSGSYSRRLPVRGDSNRLEEVPYDAAGKALEIELGSAVALAWDDRGRLAKATAAGAVTTSTYDAAGRRARKLVESGGITSERRYLGGCLVDLTPGTGSSPAFSLRVGDGAATIATIAGGTESQLRFELDDRLGSVALQLDDAARVVSYEGFLPYGGSAVVAAAAEAAVADKTFRHTGKECDDSTALYYYGARYAASWQGRWLSPDPAGTVDGLNLYAFVGGNPLTMVDREGHNGDDPGKGPSPFAGAFWRTLQQGFYLGAVEAGPRVSRGVSALVYGPPGTPAQRAALMVELGHVTREGITAVERASGFSVQPYLRSIPAVQSFLEPGRRPLLMRPLPFGGESLSQRWIRNNREMLSGAALGSVAGSVAGSALSLGSILAIGSHAILGQPTSRLGKFGRGGVIVSFSMAVSMAALHSEALTTSGPSGWIPSWSQAAGSAAGVPITAAFLEAREARARQLVPAAAVVGGLAALLLSARISGMAVVRGVQQYQAKVAAEQAAAFARSRALVPYREPSRALIPFQQPTATRTAANK